MTRLLTLLSAWLWLPLAAAASPGGEPTAWLLRMASSVQELNYAGRFVYSRAGQLETMQVVHQVDANGEREHLLSLDGSQREMVRDGDSAVCILGDQPPVWLDRSTARTAFPASRIADVDRLGEHYSLVLGGEARVAGRVARELAIRPRDQLRYGYRLLVDEQSGLPLKSELLGDSGEVLEQILFTELTLQENADPQWMESIKQRKQRARAAIGHAETPVAAAVRRWHVAELPAGFGIAAYRSYPMQQGDASVDHLVFSDGLATVSVYVEPTGSESPLSGAGRMGAVSTYARVHAGHQIVVVGDVPMATVRQIGGAVVPAPGTAQ